MDYKYLAMLRQPNWKTVDDSEPGAAVSKADVTSKNDFLERNLKEQRKSSFSPRVSHALADDDVGNVKKWLYMPQCLNSIHRLNLCNWLAKRNHRIVQKTNSKQEQLEKTVDILWNWKPVNVVRFG